MSSRQLFSDKDPFDRIKRGIGAILIFIGIFLAIHVTSFLNIMQMKYDDEAIVDGELEEDDKPNPCIWGDDYDAELCFDETKSAMLMAEFLQIVFYSVPIIGLIEIYIGIHNLSNAKEQKQTDSEENEISQSEMMISDSGEVLEITENQGDNDDSGPTNIDSSEDSRYLIPSSTYDSIFDGVVIVVLVILSFIVYRTIL